MANMKAKIKLELLVEQEGARLIRISTTKDALLLQQRSEADVRHLTFASIMSD